MRCAGLAWFTEEVDAHRAKVALGDVLRCVAQTRCAGFESHRILFYEDFPYVTRPGDETRRHNSLGQQGLHPLRHHLEISPTAITAHQDAAARYISQVNNFRLPGSAEPHFPTRDHLDRDVEWLLHTRFGKAHPPCMTLWSL